MSKGSTIKVKECLLKASYNLKVKWSEFPPIQGIAFCGSTKINVYYLVYVRL